jgi:SAM-dependent methyltransferase
LRPYMIGSSVATGTEEYYRRRATEYDAVYAKPERQADLRSLRAKLSALLSGRRVLEVAAGTGWWTDAYCEGARQVVATDINPSTLAVARSRREWPAHVGFTVADAFDLSGLGGWQELEGMEKPEPPGSGEWSKATFDGLFAGFFWSHVALRSVDLFLDSLSARLAPGALVVVMDNIYVPDSSCPIARTDDEWNTYQERFLSDGSRWEVVKNFPSTAEVAKRLSRLGDAVTVETFPYYWIATVRVPEDRGKSG